MSLDLSQVWNFAKKIKEFVRFSSVASNYALRIMRVLKGAAFITGQVWVFVKKTMQFVKIFPLCNSCNEHQGHKPLFYLKSYEKIFTNCMVFLTKIQTWPVIDAATFRMHTVISILDEIKNCLIFSKASNLAQIWDSNSIPKCL
jgi:hypothetical protein